MNSDREQIIYNILCSDEQPPEGQHWEGFVASKIATALAQPEPEPVAWSVTYHGSHCNNIFSHQVLAENERKRLDEEYGSAARTVVPLYTAPPQRKEEPEPVATLFGSLPVYDTPTQPEPVAWVENLDNARPHCVTDLRYCSVMQYERGEHLKYIPLYADPTPCQTCEALARTVMMDQVYHDSVTGEWQSLTDEEIESLRHLIDRTAGWSYVDFARAIEAKLKEKNNV